MADEEAPEKEVTDRPDLDYRSFSQYSTYNECSWKYYLQYIKRVPKQPAFWFPQGTAFHAAVEQYEFYGREIDMGNLKETYESSWDAEVAHYLENWPDPDSWMTGTHTRKGSEDAVLRKAKGWEQVEGYVEWSAKQYSHFVDVLPNGEAAVEVRFELDFGGVNVVGYIDQILIGGRVRDPKTGRKLPKNKVQLGLYGLAATQIMGKPYTTGDFYMAKNNDVTKPVDLAPYTAEELTKWFVTLNTAIEHQLFMPNPSSDCRMCSVRAGCEIGQHY